MKGQEDVKNQIKCAHGEIEEVQRKIERVEYKVHRKIEEVESDVQWKIEEIEDKVQRKISVLEKKISPASPADVFHIDGQAHDILWPDVIDCFQDSVLRCELCERMDRSRESQSTCGLSPRISGDGSSRKTR
ncbi:hypothetical protein AVEN_137889-1 [Araneus ventricosus]|uniref:Uncharacterized protein n=1 Tax=Araneus ventricosus TaxID=182803 RepID=A0A4Y2W8B7_ARAVE|nr:hypothetical protein AVEN_137889-1 [Araneus ventricosus]